MLMRKFFKKIFNKRKKTFFQYDDFFEAKDDSVREFLHYAKDHKNAAQELSKIINYFDSSGYLYHLGHEMLFKGIHLYYFGEFEKTHDLIRLHKKIKELFQLSHDEIIVIKLLNGFQHLRYPMEEQLRYKKCMIIDGIDYSCCEIGDEYLCKAENLFEKNWNILQQNPELMKIISKINWTKKGGRILMRKKTI